MDRQGEGIDAVRFVLLHGRKCEGQAIKRRQRGGITPRVLNLWHWTEVCGQFRTAVSSFTPGKMTRIPFDMTFGTPHSSFENCRQLEDFRPWRRSTFEEQTRPKRRLNTAIAIFHIFEHKTKIREIYTTAEIVTHPHPTVCQVQSMYEMFCVFYFSLLMPTGCKTYHQV